ncbi:hypothetical protein RYX36_033565 [Vicia faba]
MFIYISSSSSPDSSSSSILSVSLPKTYPYCLLRDVLMSVFVDPIFLGSIDSFSKIVELKSSLSALTSFVWSNILCSIDPLLRVLTINTAFLDPLLRVLTINTAFLLQMFVLHLGFCFKVLVYSGEMGDCSVHDFAVLVLVFYSGDMGDCSVHGFVVLVLVVYSGEMGGDDMLSFS